MSKNRPELRAPPEVIYDRDGAKKYACNSRMLKIQRDMAERALELLALPKNDDGSNQCGYLLDLGCGSGISGEALTDAGYEWVGCDISHWMLSVAVQRRVDGDLCESDLGDGLYFREGIFDGGISISTLQWITNCERRTDEPRHRLKALFTSLYKCLKRGARVVFQLYPQSAAQLELISESAVKSGFVVSVVVDFPKSTKARKIYLILDAGSVKRTVPRALTEEDCIKLGKDPSECLTAAKMRDEEVTVLGREDSKDAVREQYKRSVLRHVPASKAPRKIKRGKERFQEKNWILQYKERRREAGFRVPRDSKYTARKRRVQF